MKLPTYVGYLQCGMPWVALLIRYGVPQGSVIGQLLYVLFTRVVWSSPRINNICYLTSQCTANSQNSYSATVSVQICYKYETSNPRLLCQATLGARNRFFRKLEKSFRNMILMMKKRKDYLATMYQQGSSLKKTRTRKDKKSMNRKDWLWLTRVLRLLLSIQ